MPKARGETLLLPCQIGDLNAIGSTITNQIFVRILIPGNGIAVRVSQKAVTILEQPATNASILATLEAKVEEVHPRWFLVRLPGYIVGSLLENQVKVPRSWLKKALYH